MKKAISCINIPSLGIRVGDTIACAKSSVGLDAIMIAHSGMTFYDECRYADAPEVSPELCDAMDSAFRAGLELNYANVNFAEFMRIFSAKSIGDINRAMATCRASL